MQFDFGFVGNSAIGGGQEFEGEFEVGVEESDTRADRPYETNYYMESFHKSVDFPNNYLLLSPIPVSAKRFK